MRLLDQHSSPAEIAARLASFTLLSALTVGAVHAQTPAAAEDTTTLVVTGVRAALESALNKKRQENSIVDVIKAEDMGKFPDTNLAESLQRVPGVVIDRDAGEGRSITVRGLGSEFTRVRINGIEAIATTGGTDSSGGSNRGRGFDFNVFPSELFNALTVRKSSSPDVDEGSLGATVDLQTTRPFDLKGFNATVMVKERYNDLSKKTDPRIGFLVSDTFLDRTVGVLVSGAYSKRRVFEDGFSTVKWDNGPSSGGFCAPTGVTANPSTSTATTCGPAAQGVPRLTGTPENIAAYNDASSANNFTPRIPRYGRLVHDQDRLGLTASFQYRPQKETLLTFDMLYSKLKATREEEFLEVFSFSRAITLGGKPQISVVKAEYAPNGALQYGVFNGIDLRSEQRHDELSTTFTQPTLTLEHRFNENLRMNVTAGAAKSVFNNPIQTTATIDVANVNGYTMDFRQNSRLPLISFPVDVAQPGVMGIIAVPTGATTVTNQLPSEIRIRPQGTTNTNDILHTDFTWDANDWLSIKGGADYKKFGMKSWAFQRANQLNTMYAPDAGTSIASLTSILSGFGGGQSLPAGSITTWAMPNLNAIAKAYDIYCNCIKSGPAAGPGDYTLTSITNNGARGDNRTVNEKDTGLFLMGEFNTEIGRFPVRGNLGARYVQTDQTAKGYQAAGGGTEVSVDNSYRDFLPAFNAAINLTSDFVVRLAAAKVMSRPGLTMLTPGGSIVTTGILSISSGNPLLKPYRAKTLDTSFEWYAAKNTFVGLGLFQKNISSYIQTIRTSASFKSTGLPMNLIPSNFTGEEQFAITAPINTNGGTLRGYELNYQQPFVFLPSWGKNFGALLNYTSVKSKIAYVISPTAGATITDDLLKLSPVSWNTTLYYDDGKLSGRFTTSRRSNYLTAVPGTNNNDVEGNTGSYNVDLSITYKLSDKLEMTIEGSNLTNQANSQFVSRARESVYVNNVTGREFLAGVRYKF